MSTDTEQVTISQAAYDHLRVQISMLKDDLHHALEENNKLKAAAKAHVPDEAFNIIEGIRAELTYPGWRQASSRDKVMDWLSDLLSMLTASPAPDHSSDGNEMVGWISVDSRTPAPGDDVLVLGTDIHGATMHSVAGLFNGSWASLETQEILALNVTHWMPLPNPPQQEEAER